VARTLRWADEASEPGDYFDALAWLDTVEAIGDQLPEAYETKRDSWCAQLARTLGRPTRRPVVSAGRRKAQEPQAHYSGRS
jgi:hypothetical protein